MPLYPMVCPKCEDTFELVAHMNEEKTHECVICLIPMERDWQNMNVHASSDSYSRDIHSDALAITPAQVAEHRQHFPDVELDNQCRPVFTNYKQHNAYLEKTGFTKKRQKARRSVRNKNPRKATPE